MANEGEPHIHAALTLLQHPLNPGYPDLALETIAMHMAYASPLMKRHTIRTLLPMVSDPDPVVAGRVVVILAKEEKPIAYAQKPSLKSAIYSTCSA